MIFSRTLGVLLSMALTGLSHADVTSVAAGGFVIEQERIVRADPPEVWAAAVHEIGKWWNSDHTVSGDAARMSIDARPLGCFCEALPGNGGVVHLTVTTVSEPVMLRMTGGLGPLGLMGVNGNMTWEFFASEEGTRVKFMYAVGGYTEGGFEALAGPVDYVIGEALSRLQAYVEANAARDRK